MRLQADYSFVHWEASCKLLISMQGVSDIWSMDSKVWNSSFCSISFHWQSNKDFLSLRPIQHLTSDKELKKQLNLFWEQITVLVFFTLSSLCRTKRCKWPNFKMNVLKNDCIVCFSVRTFSSRWYFSTRCIGTTRRSCSLNFPSCTFIVHSCWTTTQAAQQIFTRCIMQHCKFPTNKHSFTAE